MNRRVDCLPPGVERICDFCSDVLDSRAAGRLYPADDTAVAATPSETLVSEGGWWACVRCAGLIDADDRVTLAGRAVTQIGARHGLVLDGTHAQFLLAVVRRMHDRFFAARRPEEEP